MSETRQWQDHKGPALDSVKGYDVIECETCGFKHIVPIPTVEELMEARDMYEERIIVQASSTAWSGGRDRCMSMVNGYPVVYWTIKRILDHIPRAHVKVAAPAFDRGGDLEPVVKFFQARNVSIFYSHDKSPLNRMLEVCADSEDEEYIIRVDGLHFCVDVDAMLNMLNLARAARLDCVKLPDDFPIQFTSDIYRVGALRIVDALLNDNSESIFRVHPKFYMFARKDVFSCAYMEDLPSYMDEYLLQCRQIAESIYRPRQMVNESRIAVGDTLGFHYELALEHLQPGTKVLDAGCSYGFGCRLLARKVAEVYGADIDPDTIATARTLTEGIDRVLYCVEDVTRMSFDDGTFDAVVSMETIEHLDGYALIQEVYRVLKPGGTFIVSTPQNRIGHIPVNAEHVREYSLEEIVRLCSQHFLVESIVGIKAGCIVIPKDPVGSNTMLVCRKR